MSLNRIKTVSLIVFSILLVILIVSFIGLLSGGRKGEKIGVVELDGVITDSRQVMKEIVRHKEDDAIRAVILRINSPGGSVAPTQEIYREIQKLKEKKKVFTSMGSVCASGGYYIASVTDKVYANPSTITGSIGVIMEQMVIEDLLKKIGIQSNTLKAGDLKDAGSVFRKMTDAERRYFNAFMKEIHDQFIADVAAGRNMPVDAVARLSDGRIYTGSHAKRVNLVDAIGNFYDAVDDLGKTAGIKGKPTLVYSEKPFSISKLFFSSLSKEVSDRSFSEPFKYLFKP